MTVGMPSADGTVPVFPWTHYVGTDFAVDMPASTGAYDLTKTYTWEFLGGQVVTGTVATDGSRVSFRMGGLLVDLIPNGTPFLLVATGPNGLRLPYGTGKWRRVVA